MKLRRSQTQLLTNKMFHSRRVFKLTARRTFAAGCELREITWVWRSSDFNDDAVSSSRRRRTGRSPSTADTEQPSSSGPPTGCWTGEQCLLGILATGSPSYLQDGGGVSSIISCSLIFKTCTKYHKCGVRTFKKIKNVCGNIIYYIFDLFEKQRTDH